MDATCGTCVHAHDIGGGSYICRDVDDTGLDGELCFVELRAETKCRASKYTEELMYEKTVSAIPEQRACHWVYFDDSVSTPDCHEDDWHLECSACGFDPESIIGPNVDDPECLEVFVHCPNCGAKVVPS